jgi:hypothetical protein
MVGRRQGLTENLATENLGTSDVATLATENILFYPLER